MSEDEIRDNLTSTSPWNHPKVMTEQVKVPANPLSYLKGHGNYRDTSDGLGKGKMLEISFIHPGGCKKKVVGFMDEDDDVCSVSLEILVMLKCTQQ
ncbi:hypothetical protein TURU_155037 [Turdus rufiventris]|nr:hypothetical protein TURU_155037 [Turdus rufiventris]